MLVRAGERAASLAAAGEARRYFEQACALAEEPLERAAILARAGVMANRTGDPDESRALFEESISLFEAEGDTHAAARVSGQYGQLLGFVHRDEALAWMERAFEVISSDPPDEDLALLAAALSRAYWFRGDLERAAERAELALDIAEAQAYPAALAIALRSKGAVAFSRGHVEESGALMLHALKVALEHDLLDQAATTYFILSDREFRWDRYREALAYLEEALKVSRKVGSRPSELADLAEMTYPLYMLGRWDEALGLFDELTEEQTQSGGVLLSLLISLARDPSGARSARRGAEDLLALLPSRRIERHAGPLVLSGSPGVTELGGGEARRGACALRADDRGGPNARPRAAERQAGRGGGAGGGHCARRLGEGTRADRLAGGRISQSPVAVPHGAGSPFPRAARRRRGRARGGLADLPRARASVLARGDAARAERDARRGRPG